ncbi:hypothetical protein [Streptomyces sp. CBMA29]|uniref:hypothetical protein n=1 Tax=Streptomyces sp. CBMA29 TaxID=1896314 RepID=UPI001661EA0C|nr:hypothetical protein [Streptomyces sp. CBMA29]MBD0734077.1 hypothetical protein [Streptomyces sp. CBMA29]
MSLRQVTVGVVGDGTVRDTLVCDALNEHFGYGPEDAEGYFAKSREFDVHLVFPVGERLFTAGVEAVWQWAVRTENAFLALADDSPFEAEEAIRATLLDPDDWQVSPNPSEDLLTVLTGGPNPMLLVITSDGQYGDELRVLASEALAAGIPVYDLARALLEQTWSDLGLEKPEPAEPAPVEAVPAATGRTSDVVALTEADYDDVVDFFGRAFNLLTELQQVAAGIENLRAALVRTERTLVSARAAAATALASLPRAETAVAVPSDSEEQEPVEQQRSASGRMRTEVYDETSGQWRPAGRGRPRAGARTRRVPR